MCVQPDASADSNAIARAHAIARSFSYSLAQCEVRQSYWRCVWV
jgi:hypothetical protein